MPRAGHATRGSAGLGGESHQAAGETRAGAGRGLVGRNPKRGQLRGASDALPGGLVPGATTQAGVPEEQAAAFLDAAVGEYVALAQGQLGAYGLPPPARPGAAA